jgi:formate hydrogenlyase subunit 6/NADH:ubiquinone oxidoreductase subunit I
MRMIFEALKGAFRKPFTQNYPKVRPLIPEGLRGRVEHDMGKCIYCGLCAKYCPSGAIEVDVKKREWRYDLGKCLMCSQCEETCRYMARANAIRMAMDFEHAERKKDAFLTVHRGTGKK